MGSENPDHQLYQDEGGPSGESKRLRRVEKELREAKIYFESIVETLHEPILVLHPDLRVRSVNQSFYDHFHVREDETVGQLVYELGNGQWDIPELRRLLEDVLPANSIFYDYEIRYEFQDIGERVMLLNARRLDSVQLILLGIRDITRQKAAEEALRESEQQHRRVIESALDYAILTTDMDRMITNWSPGAEAVFGWSAEEAVGRSADILFTPEDREKGAPEEEQQTVFRSGSAPDVRWHIRQDGARVFIEGTVWPLKDGQSNMCGLLKIGQDVSDRRKVHEALRESEARFRAVADLVPDLLWRADPSGARTWGNKQWMEYTGQTLDDAVGFGWSQVLHHEDREEALADYRAAMLDGRPFNQEYRIRNADGDYRWFLVRADPVRDEEGNITQWFGAATDVHDQRTLMDTLEERVDERTRQVRNLALKLTMAEQEERRRISQILHDDLQQLLYGIEMKMGMIRRGLSASAQPELAAQLLEAREWITKAVDTTRSLTVDLSPPILKTEGLTDTLEWLQRQMWELHQLKVELDAEHSFRMPDEEHRLLLFQIIRELLFNVKKHAGVSSARVALGEEDGDLVIVVEDRGRGFDLAPAEMRQRRHGLGLVSARERLSFIGGSMEVVSAPDKGSRITMRCPYSRPNQSRENQNSTGADDAGSR